MPLVKRAAVLTIFNHLSPLFDVCVEFLGLGIEEFQEVIEELRHGGLPYEAMAPTLRLAAGDRVLEVGLVKVKHLFAGFTLVLDGWGRDFTLVGILPMLSRTAGALDLLEQDAEALLDLVAEVLVGQLRGLTFHRLMDGLPHVVDLVAQVLRELVKFAQRTKDVVKTRNVRGQQREPTTPDAHQPLLGEQLGGKPSGDSIGKRIHLLGASI